MLAIHPRTRELRTASLLTTDITSFHAQFDRTELGTMIIADIHLIPISGGEQAAHHDPQQIRLNSFRNNYLQNKFSKRVNC